MKRTLSFVLCLAFIFSMFGSVLVGTAGAAAYKDLPANHWAVNEISYMSEKAVLQGYLGNFRPGDPVTKAEFIKIENYTFGLKNTSNQAFADVSPSKWYYTDIMKAAANGYLTTKGNFVYPDAPLTREEACALIMRYLGVKPRSSYSTFSDAGQISGEYLPYVIAATESNIIKGYPDNTFRPKNTITRAEASTVFYRMAGTIYMSSSFGTDPGANPANAVINTAGITITGANLFGTVYVTEGCENGTITLRNCNIPTGTLRIRGAATVILENCTINKVEVETSSGNGSTIIASGATNVNALEARTTTTLKNNTTGGNYGFGNVFSNMSPFSTLTLDGKFPSVEVGTPNTTIALLNRDTMIENLAVRQGASNTKLTGSGTVKMANIAAPGADFSMVPEKYNIGAGLYAMFAGVKYTGSGAENVQAKFYIVNDTLEIRSLNSASGVFYYVIVANNAPAPTAEQVIAGVAYGATPVLHSGYIVQAANVEGVVTTAALPVNTNYDLYYYFRANGAAVSGNPTKVDIFTQNAPFFAAGYPAEGALAPSAGGTYTKTIKVKGTGSATAYAIAVPKGSAVPTPSQVYEAARGTTSYNPAVIIASRATAAVSAAGEITLSLTGLQNAAYDYYVVLGVGASPVAIRSTAAAPPAGVPVLTIPTQLATNASPLVLVYSEKMYYNNAPLSTVADQTTLRALFPVTSAVAGDVPAYTVTVADNPIAPYNTTVTITPIAPATWKENTVYIVTPNSAITNAGGNAPVVKFGNFIVNVVRPSAILAPTAGVSTTDGILTLTYTQPMFIKTAEGGFADINNANAGSYFTLYKSGDSTNPIAIVVTVSDDRTTFTIDPQVDLAPNTQYVIAASASITNGAGYAPAQLTYSFTTAAQPAVATPVIFVRDGNNVIVTGQLLNAGTYTVTILYAEGESTVYYTASGTTPTNSSAKYTGPFPVYVEPLKKTTIKAFAVPNTGVDKTASPEAVRVLEGREVTVDADIPSGSALRANTEVVLSTSYGNYTIKYAKSDNKLGAAAALAAAKAGTVFNNFVDGLNGKYLYAVAVKDGEAIGPVAEFYYYDFNVTDIISPDSLSFVYEGDKVLVGFFNDLGEDALPAYPYELIVTLKVNGAILADGGNIYDNFNLGKSNFIYTIDDVYNKDIKVTAKVVASGTNNAVTFTETAQYFANPAPIIKVTTGGVTTEYVGTGNNDTIAYGAEAKFESVLPILPPGFNANAMTWGVDPNHSTCGDQKFSGIPINKTKTVQKDLSVVAKAKADVLVTSDLMLKFIAVPPRLLNAANEEHEREFVYVNDGVLQAELLTGVDNYYKINDEAEVKYENAGDGDLSFKWGTDYPDLDTVTISLWSVYTNGTPDPADDRKSEVNTYVIKKNGPSYFSPDIVVTYDDNGDDVAYTEEIPVAKLGDKVTASTKVVGAKMYIYHTEAVAGNELMLLPDGPTVSYPIEERFTGTETDFFASIDPLGVSETVRKTVRISPVVPTIVVMPDGKSFQLRMDKQHADGSEVFYSGVRYTTDGSDPIANGTDVAYDDFLDPGAFRYAKVDGDYSDGYYIRAVAYSENANARWYSAEVEKYKPDAPVVTYNGFVLKTSTKVYNVNIADKITITGGDTLYIRHAKTVVDLAAAEWTEFTSGDEFQIPADVVNTRYYVDVKVRDKDVDSNFVELIFRTTKLPTFDPATGTSIAPSGGEQITISYPMTAVKANTLGEKTYFYQFNDGPVTTFTRDDNTAFTKTVTAPAGTQGDTLTVNAGVRFEKRDAENNLIFFSDISDKVTYVYGNAPFFKAYYKDSGNFVEIPAKTDVSGTYFEVAEGTEVFLEITNEGGLTVKWNISATAEPTDLNQDYSEANAATLKSNISDTLGAGTTITDAKPLVYVAAKFLENNAMSRIQLRLNGATLPIPVSAFYKDGACTIKWSKTETNYINSTEFATFKLNYKAAPAGFDQYFTVPNEPTYHDNTANVCTMKLADFDENGQAVYEIWLEDADGNKGLVSSYTFKLTDLMTKLTSPTIIPAEGSILSAGDKIKATTEYGAPVQLWRAYVYEGTGADGNWKTAPDPIEITVPDVDQGKTTVYYAKVTSGAKESDPVHHTFYIRPIDVAATSYAFRIGADNKPTISVGKPATGTALGVVVQQDGQPAQYADFGGNPSVTFTVTDAAVKVAYYYKPTNTSVMDTVDYLAPAAGYVYSKNPLTIAAAPKITQVKFDTRVVPLDANLSATNVYYIEGEPVSATATASTDRIYSTIAMNAVYGRINEAGSYYDDIGNDIEILLNPVVFAMPFKNLTAAQINTMFKVISIQAFDAETRRFSQVAVISVIAIEAPKATYAGIDGKYNLSAIPGCTVNYRFDYTIAKKDDTATGSATVGTPVTYQNANGGAPVAPQFDAVGTGGPWVFTVKITATINEIPGYEKVVVDDTYNCTGNGTGFQNFNPIL